MKIIPVPTQTRWEDIPNEKETYGISDKPYIPKESEDLFKHLEPTKEMLPFIDGYMVHPVVLVDGRSLEARTWKFDTIQEIVNLLSTMSPSHKVFFYALHEIQAVDQFLFSPIRSYKIRVGFLSR